jgi:hypothetical protein
MESINRKITFQAGPGINTRPYSKKITKAKRAGDMVQMVEHLPSVQAPAQPKKKVRKQIQDYLDIDRVS